MQAYVGLHSEMILLKYIITSICC